MNANITGGPVLIDQIYGFCIQITASGSTPAGSFQVQTSVDDVGVAGTVTNWANCGSAIVVSAAGTTLTNFDAQYGKWMQVVFTKSTGAVGDLATVKYGLKGA